MKQVVAGLILATTVVAACGGGKSPDRAFVDCFGKAQYEGTVRVSEVANLPPTNSPQRQALRDQFMKRYRARVADCALNYKDDAGHMPSNSLMEIANAKAGL